MNLWSVICYLNAAEIQISANIKHCTDVNRKNVPKAERLIELILTLIDIRSAFRRNEPQ